MSDFVAELLEDADELDAVAEGGMDERIVRNLRASARRIRRLEAFAAKVGNCTLADEAWGNDFTEGRGPAPDDPPFSELVLEARELFE